MPRRISPFAGAMGLSIILCTSVHAGDWPRWGGTPGHNMVSAETRLPASFRLGRFDSQTGALDLASSENVRWSVPLGSETHGSPVVVRGRVLVGSNYRGERGGAKRATHMSGGWLPCLDEQTGRLIWELVAPKLPEQRAPHSDTGYGICSSPTVDGERIYVVTNNADVLCLDFAGLANGNDGPFRDEGRYIAGAFNQPNSPPPPAELKPTDADILWRYDMLAELDVHPHDASSCSVLVDGDFLYVCTGNGVDRGETRVLNPQAPSLIVLDKNTGRLVAADEEKIGTRMLKGQWSSPSLCRLGSRKLIVYGGGDGLCYAFEPVTAADPNRVLPLKKVWAVDCNPPDCRMRNGKPVAYREKDGPSEIVGTPVCVGKRVYVTIGRDPNRGQGKGNVTCIDAARGEALWSCDKIGRSMSTVSLSDGLLYVAETFGAVHCLDADTGAIQWSHRLDGRVWGSTMVADGKVYVPTSKHLVVLVADRQKQVLAEIRLESACLSTPVAANGVLYVATQEHLYAVSQTKGGPASPLTVVTPVEAAVPDAPRPRPKPAPVASRAVPTGPWPQWRGPNRDGHVPELPASLDALKVLWRYPVAGRCDAGIAVSDGRVLLADHDKQNDYYCCLRVADGQQAWKRSFPNAREMDYGAGPRATPLVYGDKVCVLSAFGELYCLSLASGEALWQKDFRKDFGVKRVPTWGYCGSPLLVRGRLIVNPGQPAALVALDADTGAVAWEGEGRAANYSSFIAGTFGGVEQVVGFDAKSLGGWELTTGKRLWGLEVETSNGYIVPTPLAVGGKLLIADTNNETQLFAFDPSGVLRTPAVAKSADYVPDVSSPVAAGDLVLGVSTGLVCLDAADSLKTLWTDEQSPEFHPDAHVLVARDRGLVLNADGELVLFRFDRRGAEILGKKRVCSKTLVHPTVAGRRLLVRDSEWLYCYELGE